MLAGAKVATVIFGCFSLRAVTAVYRSLYENEAYIW